MNLKVERKIRFWLSVIVKALIITLVIYKLTPFMFQNNDSDLPKEKTNTLVNKKTEPNSEENSLKKKIIKDSIIVNPKIIRDTNKYVKINEILRYKGKILKDAYFKIGDCNNCFSTITEADGIAKFNAPIEYVEDDNVLDFYVYTSDTLIYHKAMRFSNLQFNKY